MDAILIAHVADSIDRINVANSGEHGDSDATADFAYNLLADNPTVAEAARRHGSDITVSDAELDAAVLAAIGAIE